MPVPNLGQAAAARNRLVDGAVDILVVDQRAVVDDVAARDGCGRALDSHAGFDGGRAAPAVAGIGQDEIAAARAAGHAEDERLPGRRFGDRARKRRGHAIVRLEAVRIAHRVDRCEQDIIGVGARNAELHGRIEQGDRPGAERLGVEGTDDAAIDDGSARIGVGPGQDLDAAAHFDPASPVDRARERVGGIVDDQPRAAEIDRARPRKGEHFRPAEAVGDGNVEVHRPESRRTVPGRRSWPTMPGSGFAASRSRRDKPCWRRRRIACRSADRPTGHC